MAVSMSNSSLRPETIAAHGFRLVSGGTDNHLMLVDVFSKGLTGKDATTALGKAGITVNQNTIPFDKNPPLSNQQYTFQSGYDPSYYDARARFLYGSVTYSFK